MMATAHTMTRVRPPYRALALTGLVVALTLLAALLTKWAAPGLDPLQQRLIAVLALAAFACTVVAVKNRRLLTAGRVHPSLLIVPILVAVAPFAAGLKDVGMPAGATLILGYLATGIYEELWFRGLVWESLGSWTPLRAALLTSALFGLTHLANIAFGANPAVTAAQVVGAACFGVGMASLRSHGVALWPLVLLHALTDIALQLGDVSILWRWILMVGGDIALLVFGLVLLRTAGRPAPSHAGHSQLG